MTSLDAVSGLELIFRPECIRLLGTQEVGRLGFVSGGSPQILPVNYVMDGEAVVFATASGGKLWGAVRSPVAFEVDDTDRDARTGWSVVLHGLALEVTAADSPELVRRVNSLALRPWASGDKPHLVRVMPTIVTGRRVGPGR